MAVGRLLLGAALLLAAAPEPEESGFVASVDWSVLDGVLVQHAGRKKPLEAFAREQLWRTLGSQTWGGQPPAATALSLCFERAWGRREVLKAGHPGLAKAFGGRSRVALLDLGSEPFEALWQEASQRQGPPSALDRAVQELDRRGSLLAKTAEVLRVVPNPKDPKAPWIGMGEAGASAASPPAYNAFAAMERAWTSRDPAAFTAAARDWAAALRAAAPADYAALEDAAALERAYHRIQPFRWSCLAYFLGFLLFLGSWAFAKPALRRWGMAFLLPAFLLHGAGIAARILIAGRPPVSNMFEVILFVSWAVVAAAFAVDAVMRTGVAMLPAAGLASFGLLSPAFFPVLEGALNQSLPLDPAIGHVQAVLKNHYWLVVHVITITTSYAILFLAFGAGLLWLLAKPDRREDLDRLSWRVTQLGFLFLTAGVLTGAWWANESWGRYWGWDPKETGAFVAWCVYAAYLHLRRFGILKARGAAWMSVLGFLAILFTMIGVSYFLPGLHSYA